MFVRVVTDGRKGKQVTERVEDEVPRGRSDREFHFIA